MSTDPKDGGPTTESREEKRVEITTETAPVEPEPVKETVTETTETVTEPVSDEE